MAQNQDSGSAQNGARNYPPFEGQPANWYLSDQFNRGEVTFVSGTSLDVFVQNTLYGYDYVDILKNLERYPILTVTGEPFVPKRIPEEPLVVQRPFSVPSLPPGNIGCNVFFDEGPSTGPKCVPNNLRFVNPSRDECFTLYDEVRHFQKWMQNNQNVLFAGMHYRDLYAQAEQYKTRIRNCLVGVRGVEYNSRAVGMSEKHKILIFVAFMLKVLADFPALLPKIRLFQLFNGGYRTL